MEGGWEGDNRVHASVLGLDGLGISDAEGIEEYAGTFRLA